MRCAYNMIEALGESFGLRGWGLAPGWRRVARGGCCCHQSVGGDSSLRLCGNLVVSEGPCTLFMVYNKKTPGQALV